MSEFNKNHFLRAFETAAHKAQQDLSHASRLANAIKDKNAPEPADLALFGYCASASMKFDMAKASPDSVSSAVAELLAAYPPLDIVDLVNVRTQKPVEALRANETSESYVELYPVVFKKDHRSYARWWTHLAGETVEINAEGAQAKDFPIPLNAYVADSHTYSTGYQSFYRRAVKQYPSHLDAELEAFAKPLEEFAQGLSAPGAKAVVRAIIDRVRRPGLGVPVVSEGMLLETIRQDENPLRRLSPSRYFNAESAAEVVRLTEKAAQSLASLLQTSGELLQHKVEEGAQRLAGILQRHHGEPDGLLVREALQQILDRDVGAGVRLSWLKYDRVRKCFELRVQLILGVSAKTFFKDVCVPVQPDASPLSWKALGLEFVEI